MSALFDSLKLRSVTLRNRIGVSPMCQYSAEDGVVNDWHLVHLGSRAVGGAGLVIAEATAVSPEGRISPGDAGIWNDNQGEAFSRIARFIKSQGAVPGIQLAHAGRKASATRPWEGDKSITEGAWQTIAPSAIPFGGPLTHVPTAASKEEIARIKKAFKAAAKRALDAGFELIEFHAAHGYLAHSFYSPLSNQRTDEYGGIFENRVRFVMETVGELRSAWPDHLPLSIRLSCTDWIDGGWTIDETVKLTSLLKQAGVDIIDCSSGFNTPEYRAIPFGAGFQTPFSERIKKEVGVATAAVGVIVDPMQADEIIRNGRADMVLLARQMLREPYWAANAAERLRKAESLKLPPQYSHWLK